MDVRRDRHGTGTLRQSILGSATGLRVFKVVTGGNGRLSRMATQYVKPRPGERILDVGCGYGDLATYLSDVHYVGIDISEPYITYARHNHGESAEEFVVGDVADLSTDRFGTFDAAVALGVMHHLSDADVTSMLSSIAKMLNSTGRFISSDPVWEPSQRTTARVLAALDRGRYVRDEIRYQQLVAPWFSQVDSDIRHDLFWFPYTHCMITATAKGGGDGNDAHDDAH